MTWSSPATALCQSSPPASLAIPWEVHFESGQPFFAGVEELVYQVLLDSDVSRQHISDEAVGELVFLVERANHFVFLNDEHGGGCNRGRSRYANGLARKAPFPKKITRSKERHNGFFAALIDDSELHTTFLNVHDILRGIALREDGFFSSKLSNLSPRPAESRNNFRSKAGLLESAFRAERRTLTDARRAAEAI